MATKTISKEKRIVVKSLIESGTSYRKIQEILPDVSLASISRINKQIDGDKGLVELFRKNRAQEFSLLQKRKIQVEKWVLDSLTEAEVKKMSYNEKFKCLQTLDTGVGIMYDKERLELDKSTENASLMYHYIIEVRDKMRKEDEQEQRKYQEQWKTENAKRKAEIEG